MDRIVEPPRWSKGTTTTYRRPTVGAVAAVVQAITFSKNRTSIGMPFMETMSFSLLSPASPPYTNTKSLLPTVPLFPLSPHPSSSLKAHQIPTTYSPFSCFARTMRVLRHSFSRLSNAGEDYDDEYEDDDEDGEEGIAPEEDMGASVVPERWDVLGLGQAMVILLYFSFLFGC